MEKIFLSTFALPQKPEAHEELRRVQDNELAARVASGSSDAVTDLVERFQAQMMRDIRKNIGFDSEDWQDLLQVALMRIVDLLRAEKYDSSKGALGQFVFGVTRNTVRDYRKKRFREAGRETRLEGAVLDQISLVPSSVNLEKTEKLSVLEHCIETLKDHHQMVLKLRYFQELAMGEIAAMLQKQEQQIIDLHRYAIQKLKECAGKVYRLE